MGPKTFADIMAEGFIFVLVWTVILFVIGAVIKGIISLFSSKK